MIEVKAQKRSKLAEKILDTINEVGQDKIITVIMDEGGKFAGDSLFSSLRAYIYYKD